MITVKIKHRTKGSHVHLAVYLGLAGTQRALALQGAVRVEEWAEVRAWLTDGHVPYLELEELAE